MFSAYSEGDIMAWNFDDIEPFEFSVIGYAARLNGKYEMKGVLKQIVRNSRSFKRLTKDTATTALGEEGNIFDLRTETGRDYFIAVADEAAYVVLGNSQWYSYVCCWETPLLKIENINPVEDILTLSEVDNKKNKRLIGGICDLVKRSARDVHSIQKNVILQVKKEKTTSSEPLQ